MGGHWSTVCLLAQHSYGLNIERNLTVAEKRWRHRRVGRADEWRPRATRETDRLLGVRQIHGPSMCHLVRAALWRRVGFRRRRVATLGFVPACDFGAALLGRFTCRRPAVAAATATAAAISGFVPCSDLRTALRRTLAAAAIVATTLFVAVAPPVAVAVAIPPVAIIIAVAPALTVATALLALALLPFALKPAEQAALQSRGDFLQVHEIAVAAAAARRLLKLAAARILEVGDRAELGQDWPPCVKAAHEFLQSALGVLLLTELGVDISRQVVAEVLAHAELLQLAADVGQLLEDVFVELLEVVL
eukprot:CAMPEP_0119397506 /NCGR_PEP_ID=MMETSP1334-20130426/140369_1 /TAXON_ID=127549 /ORGANISM="Calcidiscus leptoporus, Strain RCC1130" /LENGTH=304 /DNA_ID=CAMNT_0007421349 /DNA_START=117 /DNA_END=1031 /DNA_ORIENTATION=+